MLTGRWREDEENETVYAWKKDYAVNISNQRCFVPLINFHPINPTEKKKSIYTASACHTSLLTFEM